VVENEDRKNKKQRQKGLIQDDDNLKMFQGQDYQHIVSDVSYYKSQDSYKKNWFIYKIWQMYYKLMRKMRFKRKIPMFTPFHALRIGWDIFQAVQIYLCYFIFCLLIFFEMNSIPSSYTLFLFFGFIVDMTINMNTGYLDKGNVILDRALAMKFYFKKNFVYDIVSLIPLLFLNFNIYLSNILYNIIIWSLIFFKYQTLKIILQRLENFFTF
jgi:hypothetical protein